MSDKQRMAHNAARYWEGPLTRAEAQKVFDEMAGVIQKTQETLVKLDLVLAFLVEKSGAATEDIQAWMDNRVKEMQAKMKAAQEAPDNGAVEAQLLPDAQPALVTLD
jgi:hypothetical protein